MPGAHAKLAPSASKRWMNCTASPGYIQALKDGGARIIDRDSVYSIEGTQAHEWATLALTGTPDDQIPEEFRPHVIAYRDACLSASKGKGIQLIESKVPLFYAPDETGTVDFGKALTTGKAIHQIVIRDLKYGQGVPVDAVENTQLAIYAMSFIADLEAWYGHVADHAVVDIGIHQPRYVGDEPLKLWELSVGELREFCGPIQATADRIFSTEDYRELEFHASEGVCQFCPAAAICKKKAETAFGNIDLFVNMDLPEVEKVETDEIVSIWKNRAAIVNWLNQAEEHLTRLLVGGERVEGLKLVQGREGNRKWKDEKVAEKALVKLLDDKAFAPRQLVSPSKAEELAPKEDKKTVENLVRSLVTRSEGKPVVVDSKDKREEYVPAATAFEVLSDDE